MLRRTYPLTPALKPKKTQFLALGYNLILVKGLTSVPNHTSNIVESPIIIFQETYVTLENSCNLELNRQKISQK